MIGKLLDTTILIDLSRGNTEAANFIDATFIYLSPPISIKAYELMLAYSKSHGLTIPDALIAATAITQGLELATDNERHFSMISELMVQCPY
jgi:predicted nucleic acid-binding protein